ncbi:hypothetical protein HB848_07575 [Listeria rocourtiae]|uniref:toxin Cry1Ac domain D-VI-related protein n=1 Tax=Listeria rocourtiae TaxID=647910 RepID=UPI001626CD6E|nr:toxin Cry1Ac domain D-VI-related protein [Listeria rocourtiae]MBC1435199.1 hypothetical protein [Listeria rocourtiae]
MKKQIISTATIISIIGASVVVPFNVVTEPPVKAAVSATAPVYTAPVTYPAFKEFSKTNVSAYLSLIEFHGVYLEIDMTKLAKGYGLQVKLPDGTSKTQYATTAVGVAEKMYINILNQEYTQNTRISIHVIAPDGKVVEQNDAALTGADFIGDAETGLQNLGQKVYNLYQNSMLVTLAIGITQNDVDAAESAALTVEDSAEKNRLMNLLNEAQQQLDTNTNIQISQQNQSARQAVNALFKDNAPTGGMVVATLTQSAIDSAKALVNQLIDSAQKTAMLADVQQAQNLFNSNQNNQVVSNTPPAVAPIVATNAVLGLFANNNPSTNVLKSTTDQQAIEAAQQLVDGVADATVRANMQVSIEQAKALLKVKNTAQDYSLLANDADITSTAITGTAGRGVTSVRLLIDGVAKATGTLNTDGSYSIGTQNFITQGSKVEVVGYNGTIEVARKTVKVSNNEKPLVPGTNEALAKTMAGNAVKALFTDDNPSSNTLKPTTAQKTIDFAQNMINVVVDQVVKANIQKDLDKAQNLLDASYNLTVNNATLKATTITGTVGSNITSARLAINGVVKKTGKVNADGTYSIANDGFLVAGSKVEVIGYSGSTEQVRKVVTIIQDDKPVLEGITVDHDFIKGSVTAGSATSFRVSINGVAIKTGTIAADGTFQSSVGKQALGTVIKIEIKDGTGYNPLRVASTTVSGGIVSKLVVPTLQKMDGNYIIGTAPKGTESITIYESGVAVRAMSISAMTTNPDGSFTFKAYVTPSAPNVQVQAKNSNKLMTSDLSALFTK